MTGSTISTRFSFNKEDKLTNQSLEGYEKDFRPYVLNPKYSCPTSLPLYFYFGYQLLQEKKTNERLWAGKTSFFLHKLMSSLTNTPVNNFKSEISFRSMMFKKQNIN